MADYMSNWYEGPGIYRALEFNIRALDWLGGAEIDPIPANCEFIAIGNTAYVRLGFDRIKGNHIFRAEKIETKSYYDFITDDGSGLLGMPRSAEFIPFDMFDRAYICKFICNDPPPNVDPHEMVKMGAVLMWVKTQRDADRDVYEISTPFIIKTIIDQCERDVELATSPTLKMKTLKALRDARGTYDVAAARSTLPAMFRPDFDKYVASEAHMKSAR
jgi:hypothetical protein